LDLLSNGVEVKRKANKKLHEVWKLSFDWKKCNSHLFFDKAPGLFFLPLQVTALPPSLAFIFSAAAGSIIATVFHFPSTHR
jgi:hypothetical protein